MTREEAIRLAHQYRQNSDMPPREIRDVILITQKHSKRQSSNGNIFGESFDEGMLTSFWAIHFVSPCDNHGLYHSASMLLVYDDGSVYSV